MIGRVRGIVVERHDNHVVIDTGGVGYVVYCSERTLAAIPAVGERAVLHTDLLVREDLLQLFGFRSARERELHRLLLTVQGVGARAALAMVSAIGVEGVIRSIILQDANSIRAAQGVGPKLAQRVVNELQDKTAALAAAGGGESVAADDAGDEEVADLQHVQADDDLAVIARTEAISAIVNLGYRQPEAIRMVTEVAAKNPEMETADLIREALKRLAPG